MKTKEYIQLLKNDFNIKPARLQHIEQGHTNTSYLVLGDSENDYVMRISWPGKPAAQVQMEEDVLLALASDSELPVPAIVSTTSGAYHSLTGDNNDRYIHVFSKLEGEVEYRWYETDRFKLNHKHRDNLMSVISRLHARMSSIPVTGKNNPLERTCERIRSLPKDGTIKHPTGLLKWERFHSTAQKVLEQGRSLSWNTAHRSYCHGDLQLENILFKGDEVKGLVDFDALLISVIELDIMFALFSLTRHRGDAVFSYDIDLFERCMEKYLDEIKSHGVDLSEELLNSANREIWQDLFCLDQLAMHLDCAVKGIWKLEPRIGFYPCLKKIMN